MKQSYDCIVLGAGVAGLGAAFHLAEQDFKVLVLSKKKLKGEASPRAAGILDPFLEIESPKHPQFSMNITAFREFSKHLQMIEHYSKKDCGFKKTGMLLVARNLEEHKELKARFHWQRRFVKMKFLDRATLFKREPKLNPSVLSGLYYPDISRVYARKFQASLRLACINKGIHFKEIISAQPVIKNQAFAGIRHGSQYDMGRILVDAEGCWTGNRPLFQMKNMIRPIRGQIVIIRTEETLLKNIVHSLKGSYIVPWDQGEYLLGSTVEDVGFKPEPTKAGMKRILNQVSQMMALKTRFQIRETWAGLRPLSKDGLPLVGPAATGGIYLCSGFYRSGILLSMSLGKLLAKGIARGKMPPELWAFSPSRFK